MLAWPSPILQDPVRLTTLFPSRRLACTAPCRTESNRIPCGSQWGPGHTQGRWRPEPHPIWGSRVAGTLYGV
jgi:hypothetical protein